jgi:hypothetical protein
MKYTPEDRIDEKEKEEYVQDLEESLQKISEERIDTQRQIEKILCKRIILEKW